MKTLKKYYESISVAITSVETLSGIEILRIKLRKIDVFPANLDSCSARIIIFSCSNNT